MNKLDPRDTYTTHVDSLKERHGRDEALRAAIGGEFDAFGVLERELLIQYGLGPNDYLVDVGCGSGRLARPLSEYLAGRYLGIDVVPDLLDYARGLVDRPDWRFELTEGIGIPEQDEQADMVAFFSVFTHLLQEQTFMYLAEARRVLKTGGRVVFSFLDFAVPSHWEVFEKSVATFHEHRPLDVFTGRDAIAAWADHLNLTIDIIVAGDKPHIRLGHPVTTDSGRVLETMAQLGQSICVLSKRTRLFEVPAWPDAMEAPRPVYSRPGLYDPSTGLFHLEAFPHAVTFGFGSPGKLPVAGDWEGDGVSRVGIYDPETGTFHLARVNAYCEASRVFAFGEPGLVPVAGDWDGDGIDSVGVYDPATGAFHLRNAHTGGAADESFVFGAPGLVPIAGDWDGDGVDSVGVYDPATGAFHLKNAHANGAADASFTFGAPGLMPVAGDWDGDAVATVGVYDARVGVVLLRNGHSGGDADVVYGAVPTDRIPVAGRW